jgi:Ferritin-like domain
VNAPPQDGDSRSRRTLLIGGAGTAAATAALLAGCSGSKPLRLQVRSGAKVAPGDIIVLNQLLDLEHRTIAAYTAGLPLLGQPATKAAQQFLSQELAHAQSLSDLIRQAGGKPDEPRASYDLGRPADETEVLQLLRGLEATQLAAYVAMIPGLTPGKLRSAVVAIFANDAQHLSVIRAQLNQTPIPSAFVTGA